MISLSISAVLLSASLLIYTAKPANAQSSSFPSRDDGRKYDAVSNANSYYLLWNTQTGVYKVISPGSSGHAPDWVVGNSTDKFW